MKSKKNWKALKTVSSYLRQCSPMVKVLDLNFISTCAKQPLAIFFSCMGIFEDYTGIHHLTSLCVAVYGVWQLWTSWKVVLVNNVYKRQRVRSCATTECAGEAVEEEPCSGSLCTG